MTKKQRDALSFIKDFTETNGYTPSFIEIRDALGLSSKSGVHRLLTSLAEQGFIRRLPRRARAIEVVENPTIPRHLYNFTLDEIVGEVKRRGMVIGHIFMDENKKRSFKQIYP